jgi:hypothetical protein
VPADLYLSGATALSALSRARGLYLVARMDDTSTWHASTVAVTLIPLVGAPRLARPTIHVGGDETVGELRARVVAGAGLRTDAHVYLYIRRAFMPAPNESVGALCALYGSGARLDVTYSTTAVFGRT